MSRGKFLYLAASFLPSVRAEEKRIYQAGYDAELKGEDVDKELERYSSKLERNLFLMGVVHARRDQWKKEGKDEIRFGLFRC